MNRLDKIALATAVAATLLSVTRYRFAFEYYADQMLPGSLVVAALGWGLATYGPLVVAVAFWRSAKHFPSPVPLMLHLLFVPCAFAALAAGDAVMLSTINDPDFDATLGAPELPAFMALIVSIFSYFIAVTGHVLFSKKTLRS